MFLPILLFGLNFSRLIPKYRFAALHQVGCKNLHQWSSQWVWAAERQLLLPLETEKLLETRERNGTSQTRSILFGANLEAHTCPQSCSSILHVTFDPESFATSVNLGGLDREKRAHLCFPSAYWAVCRNRKSPEAIKRIRHFSLSISLVSLCPGAHTPSISHRSRSPLASPIIQLSFNPQAKNNPWTVNQCRGVVAADCRGALTGPRGLQMERDQVSSIPSPAAANQNKAQHVVKPFEAR